jgi:hypothetical protein
MRRSRSVSAKRIANLPTEQQISVAGEGLARVGEIVGLRAERYLQEINYLLHPNQEPVMALDAFDRYVRQSMGVDLEQFCAAPELYQFFKYQLQIKPQG